MRSRITLAVWLLDALALWALVTTQELWRDWGWVLLAGATVGLILRFLGRPAPRAVLIAGVVFLIAASVGVSWKLRWPPVVVAAHGASLLHVLLTWAASSGRNDRTRILMGFVNLSLAASLVPDAYLGVVLFFFVNGAAVVWAFDHWARELALHPQAAIAIKTKEMRRYFLYCSAWSLLTLAGSLVIFPFLPRPGDSLAKIFPTSVQSRVGYTEQVRLGGAFPADDTSVVLRVFLPASLRSQDSAVVGSWIPGRLFRARTLDRWIGEGWEVALPSREERTERPVIPAEDSTTELEMIREPIDSAVLPAPVSARQVGVTVGPTVLPIVPGFEGEWFALGFERRRLKYKVKIYEGPLPNHFFLPRNPWRVHREWNEAWVGEQERRQWKAWIESNRRGTPEDTVRVLMGRLASSEFRAGRTAPVTPVGKGAGWRAVQDFLFQSKVGHCELYASALALSLRALGVPARLVTGFRSYRDPSGGVLTVRQSDAHAWVEAYLPNRGWITLDPTPSTLGLRGGWIEAVRDLQDLAAGFWYRSILGLEAEWKFDWKWAWMGLGVAALVSLVLGLGRSRREWVSVWKRRLGWGLRWEILVREMGWRRWKSPDSRDRWRSLMLRACYGPEAAREPRDVRALQRLLQEMRSC